MGSRSAPSRQRRASPAPPWPASSRRPPPSQTIDRATGHYPTTQGPHDAPTIGTRRRWRNLRFRSDSLDGLEVHLHENAPWFFSATLLSACPWEAEFAVESMGCQGVRRIRSSPFVRIELTPLIKNCRRPLEVPQRLALGVDVIIVPPEGERAVLGDVLVQPGCSVG